MKLKLYILTFLFTSLVSAQVSFVAKASKTKLGINERIRIDFVMNKDGDNFNPPSFENFKIIGGPNQSISTSYVNGKRSFKKTYSYFLSPTKRGTFNIQQATIVIDGESYKSNPLRITVTAAVDRPKDPNDPDYVADQGVHLVAEISKTNPYLNEAVSVVYKLYLSPDISVDNWNEIDSPRYNDFWSQNIKIQKLSLENGTYKGENYRYIVLKKAVLYPQKTGKLIIEPLVLDVALRVPTNRQDIFGRPLLKSVSKTVSAGNRTINAKALPTKGKPLNFSGAVGNFKFNVKTSKDQLKATEAFQINLEVSGEGNLKLFKLPTLNLPSSLEVYEPEHTEKINTNLSGMRGEISDSYTVVPNYQGKYPIPSITFNYFDLKTQRYKTITSKEIVIDVTQGPINTQSASSTIKSSPKQNIITSGNQFATFKTKTTFKPLGDNLFFRTKLFWILFFSPFLAIPAAIILKRKNDKLATDIEGNKIRQSKRLAKKYLSEAKKAVHDKDKFYNALERALHNYLKSKIKIETSEFSKLKIKELLKDKSVETTAIDQFIDLLESCELARYTPFTNLEIQQDYNKASKVISVLDKQIRK